MVRLRVVVLGLFLAALLMGGGDLWQSQRRARLVGLTDAPCAADHRSVTGSDFDDWGALCFYRAANAALRRDGVKPEVVMIGDSITMGWPSVSGPKIVNRGIGRQSSSQILLRFRQDAMNLAPRVVHLLVGTNDVYGTTGPVTLDQIEGNVRTMAQIAHARGIRVILGTMPPLAPPHSLFAPDPADAPEKVNRMLRALAREEHLVLADYHAALAHPDGTVRKGMFEDGVHPSASGYAAMQPVFNAALAAARDGAGT